MLCGPSSYNMFFLFLGIIILCIIRLLTIKIIKYKKIKQVFFSNKFFIVVIIIGSIFFLLYQNYLILNINYMALIYDDAATLSNFRNNLSGICYFVNDSYDSFFIHYPTLIFLTSVLYHFKNFIINSGICDVDTVLYICKLLLS